MIELLIALIGGVIGSFITRSFLNIKNKNELNLIKEDKNKTINTLMGELDNYKFDPNNYVKRNGIYLSYEEVYNKFKKEHQLSIEESYTKTEEYHFKKIPLSEGVDSVFDTFHFANTTYFELVASKHNNMVSIGIKLILNGQNTSILFKRRWIASEFKMEHIDNIRDNEYQKYIEDYKKKIS